MYSIQTNKECLIFSIYSTNTNQSKMGGENLSGEGERPGREGPGFRNVQGITIVFSIMRL